MPESADILSQICDLISVGELSSAADLVKERYPFQPMQRGARRYTPFESVCVFLRDGFIDRYSGAKLVNPAVLRLISAALPEDFPAHPNWVQSKSHFAYWELFPTIDHIVPVARSGSDSRDNWITTSMLRNSAKGNALLEEIGWTLHSAGNLSAWDGLTGWIIDYFTKQDDNLRELSDYPCHQHYISRWVRASIRAVQTLRSESGITDA